MNQTSHILHPAFTLNGISFESVQEFLDFAGELIEEGDDHEVMIGKFIQKWCDDQDHITLKTSGSTGKKKKIQLSKKAMINSAKATGTFFKLPERTSALLCLPPKYIAGKMMVVRAMVLGWELHVVAPEKDALVQYDNDYDFAALVPYQVYHSIEDLNKVKKLIIGGGPVPKDLEALLQGVNTEVFATYGMTETITHVAIRRVNGPAASNIYAALPNVKFSLDDRGCLVVTAQEILEKPLVTNDLVEIKTPTSFIWLGRIDNMINSGGVKIFPENVEEKLRQDILFPFIVASEKDELLGERVILVLEKNDESKLQSFSEIFGKLEPYERPKKIYTVSKFPYTETGKIKRMDVVQMLKKYK